MRAVQSVHVIVFRSDEFIFALGAQPPLSPGGPKLLICDLRPHRAGELRTYQPQLGSLRLNCLWFCAIRCLRHRLNATYSLTSRRTSIEELFYTLSMKRNRGMMVLPHKL